MPRLVDSAIRVVEGPAASFFTEALSAAEAVDTVFSALATRVDSVAGNLDRFAKAAGDGVPALIADARNTLGAISRVATGFEDNPSRILTGGASGPRYSPQRR
jgi:hypothetical protein